MYWLYTGNILWHVVYGLCIKRKEETVSTVNRAGNNGSQYYNLWNMFVYPTMAGSIIEDVGFYITRKWGENMDYIWCC